MGSSGDTSNWQNRQPGWYRARIFGDPLGRTALPHVLLTSKLAWYWECGGLPAIEGKLSIPPRPMTELTVANAAMLLDDIEKQDIWHYGREIVLFGVDLDTPSSLVLDTNQWRVALESFAFKEKGPIRIIVVQESDMPYECVFVPQVPIGKVLDLLKQWGINVVTDQRIPDGRAFGYFFGLP